MTPHFKIVMPAQAGTRRKQGARLRRAHSGSPPFKRCCRIAAGMTVLIMSLAPLPAAAQEHTPAMAQTAPQAQTPETQQPVAMPPPPMPEMMATYAPQGCEFSAGFPSAPTVSKECEKDNPERCFEQASFTQVYDMAATVSFRVICNPADAKIKDAYTGEIMQETLRATTDKSVVKTINTNFHEGDGYKMAGLVGEGMTGRTPTLYVAQLWIGDHSSLSVEAKLVGDQHPDADALFGGVMRSVHFTGEGSGKPQAAPTAPPAQRAE